MVGQGIEMASFVAAGKEQAMNIGGIVGCVIAAYFAGNLVIILCGFTSFVQMGFILTLPRRKRIKQQHARHLPC